MTDGRERVLTMNRGSATLCSARQTRLDPRKSLAWEW